MRTPLLLLAAVLLGMLLVAVPGYAAALLAPLVALVGTLLVPVAIVWLLVRSTRRRPAMGGRR